MAENVDISFINDWITKNNSEWKPVPGEKILVWDTNPSSKVIRKFKTMLDDFYTQRGWDLKTSKPGAAKVKSLNLTV